MVIYRATRYLGVLKVLNINIKERNVESPESGESRE